MTSKIYTVTVSDDEGVPAVRGRVRAVREPFETERLAAWFTTSMPTREYAGQAVGTCPSCGVMLNHVLGSDLLLRTSEVDGENRVHEAYRGSRFDVDHGGDGFWLPVEHAVAARPVNDLEHVAHDGPAAGLGYSWGTVVASCRSCRGDRADGRASRGDERRAAAVAGLFRGLSTDEGGDVDPAEQYRTIDGGFDVLDADGLSAILAARHEALSLPAGLQQYV